MLFSLVSADLSRQTSNSLISLTMQRIALDSITCVRVFNKSLYDTSRPAHTAKSRITTGRREISAGAGNALTEMASTSSRSEESRVGKEGVITGRSRGWRVLIEKKKEK